MEDIVLHPHLPKAGRTRRPRRDFKHAAIKPAIHEEEKPAENRGHIATRKRKLSPFRDNAVKPQDIATTRKRSVKSRMFRKRTETTEEPSLEHLKTASKHKSALKSIRNTQRKNKLHSSSDTAVNCDSAKCDLPAAKKRLVASVEKPMSIPQNKATRAIAGSENDKSSKADSALWGVETQQKTSNDCRPSLKMKLVKISDSHKERRQLGSQHKLKGAIRKNELTKKHESVSKTGKAPLNTDDEYDASVEIDITPASSLPNIPQELYFQLRWIQERLSRVNDLNTLLRVSRIITENTDNAFVEGCLSFDLCSVDYATILRIKDVLRSEEI